ncbi:MAG: hypothetical protein ACFFD9_11115 [Candidatus Thorarchaeota archaeon]
MTGNRHSETPKQEEEDVLKEKLAKYTKAVADNPNDSKAWYEKMCIHFKLNQFDEALECTKTVLTQKPSWGKFVKEYFPDLPDKMAKEKERMAKEKEASRAAADFKTKLLITLEDPIAISSGVGDWKEKIGSLEGPALELFRGFLIQWERSDITQGGTVKHVVGPAGGLIISGETPEAYTEAVTLFRGGQLRKPMEIIESSLKKKEHFGLWALLGLINNKLEYYDKALGAFEAAASKNPYLKDIWDGMTTALNALKNPDKAQLTSQIAGCCPIKLDLKGESPLARLDELLRRRG